MYLPDFFRSAVSSLLVMGMIFPISQAFAEPLPFAVQPFSDVSVTYPYASAIEYLRQQNIFTDAETTGRFEPDGSITRGEIVMLLTNPFFMDIKQTNICLQTNEYSDDPAIFFSDVLRTDPYACQICIAKARQLVSGYPDHTFRPNNPVTFVEAAKMLSTVFMGKDIHDTDPVHWYEQYTRWLSDANVIPLSVHSFQQVLTRGEVAEMLFRIKTNTINLKATHYQDLIRRQRRHITAPAPIDINLPETDLNECPDCAENVSGPGRIPHPRVYENTGSGTKVLNSDETGSAIPTETGSTLASPELR